MIIVVSYNSAAELPDCLDSLMAQHGVDLEIHVVDNASADGSAELVRARYPQVRLRANRENLGFAGANNQILTTSSAPYFALVNPDTVLAPGVIATCLNLLEQRADVGVVATRLTHPDGTPQPSCHSFLNLTNLFGESFGLDRVAPSFRPLSSLNVPWLAPDRPADVDWIQGAFLVVRGEVLKKVGGFDPQFFMFAEEMDWCFRIRCAGWKVTYLPDPPVVHLGGASSRPIAGPMFVEILKGRIRFLQKHRGDSAAAWGRALIVVSVLLRLGWNEAKALARFLTGRPWDEALRLRVTIFRAAARWILQGLPLSSPMRAGAQEDAS